MAESDDTKSALPDLTMAAVKGAQARRLYRAFYSGLTSDPPAGVVVKPESENIGRRAEILVTNDDGGGSANNTSSITNVFKGGSMTPRLGRLYLERLEFTPMEAFRGDLIHSIALAPNESIRVSHKVWTTTTQEFERLVGESFEDYSESGVTEKTELTQSTETEAKHSVGRDLQANASATFGVVTVGAQGKLDVKDDDSTSRKDSLSHSVELTHKASSRVKKDYKTSFKVVTTTGTEDTSSQSIINPSWHSSLRVDYFQLLKRWRVQLFRYDLRMGVDIVVPNPGAQLFAPLAEIEELKNFLASSFQFDVPLDSVTPETYIKIASQYGATVAGAPPDGTPPQLPIVKTFVSDIGGPYTNTQDADSADPTRFATFDFEIDAGYEADELHLENAFQHSPDLTGSLKHLESSTIRLNVSGLTRAREEFSRAT